MLSPRLGYLSRYSLAIHEAFNEGFFRASVHLNQGPNTNSALIDLFAASCTNYSWCEFAHHLNLHITLAFAAGLKRSGKPVRQHALVRFCSEFPRTLGYLVRQTSHTHLRDSFPDLLCHRFLQPFHEVFVGGSLASSFSY